MNTLGVGGAREKYPVPGRLVADLIGFLLVPELRRRKAASELAKAQAEAEAVLRQRNESPYDGAAGILLKFKD